MFSIDAMAKLAKGSLLSSTFLTVLTLSACGGGGGGGADTPGNTETISSLGNNASEQAITVSPATTSITRQEAARFLTQATFGPTDTAITEVMSKGYSGWLDSQFTKLPAVSYRIYWEARDKKIKTVKPTANANTIEINHAFWANAIGGEDQLRQRVALALSEIFVVSVQDACAQDHLLGTAGYLDMLNKMAFGSYRDLLESVAKHPIMGCYLSHLKNQKEDNLTGRVPDENFAREVMQLFSIGLVQLNQDGSPKLGSNGQPIETYSASDVSGLAKVFTGWSWDCPKWPSDSCFVWGSSLEQKYVDRWALPMRPYAKFHSQAEKKFLGTTIPANTDPDTSLRVAMNTLMAHPNTAPFISKQLIQRLVTSNPSPAYVSRIAAVFKSFNGNLQATVKAILLDPEARDFRGAVTSTKFGKVREPILKFSAILRAYGASSKTGSYLIWNTNDPGFGLGQAIVQAPSVFNYFRPGYIPPNSATASANLVAPEMQIVHETSAAGFVNFIRDGLWNGWGSCGYDNLCQSTTNSDGLLPDVRLAYQIDGKHPLRTLATTAAALVEDANQRLMYGTMPADLKADIIEAVESIYVGSKTKQTWEDAAETNRRKVMTAIFLTVASPEYQVQK